MSDWIEFGGMLKQTTPDTIIYAPAKYPRRAEWYLSMTQNTTSNIIDYSMDYWEFPTQEEAQKAYDKLKARLLGTREVYSVKTSPGTTGGIPLAALVDNECRAFWTGDNTK